MVDPAVFELDRGIDALAAEAFELVAFATADRSFHELEVNPLLVERLVDLPARGRRDLEPLVAAAVSGLPKT